MPVEFIGMIGTRDQSEIRAAQGPLIDPGYTRRFARAHEDAGFDRVLIGYGSAWPEGTQVAAYAASQTERLGLLIAHRPGFVAPTLAARTLATLDHFSNGRVAVHIITGGNDAERRRDGDYLDKDERYARTDDYLEVLVKAWTSSAPFDHTGAHYKVEDFYAEVKPLQQPRPNIYFGGSSEAAYRVGGKHADVYAPSGVSRSPRRRSRSLLSTRPPGPRGARRCRASACRSVRSWDPLTTWPGSGPSGSSTRPSRGWPPVTAFSPLPASPPGARHRTPGRSAYWRPRLKQIVTTGRFGPPWPPPRELLATRRLSWAPPKPSRRPSWTMSTSVSRRCSFVAMTPTTTPSTMAVISCRSCAKRCADETRRPGPARLLLS